MNDDFNTKLQMAIWGALAGGVVSLVVNFFLLSFLPWLKRRNLTAKVKVASEINHGNHARLRVYNGGYWTMGGAMAYITLDVQIEDVLKPPTNVDAFITPNLFVPIESQQLAWSVRYPTANPMKVDILAKERQPISPCQITSEYIVLVSEEGWDWPKDRKWIARAYVRSRKYEGTLKILSSDTDARYFKIEIDPARGVNPLVVRPLSKREIKAFATLT